MRFVVIGLLGLVLGAPAHATASEGPHLFGYVKGQLFERLAAPYLLDRAGTRLQLGVEGGGARSAYHVAVNLDLGYRQGTSSDASQSAVRVEPVEAYFELLGDRLELRLGRQLIFWGRNPWTSPLDVVTAWDYGRISGDVEDYRLAPTAARLRWLLRGELELDLVWVPILRSSRLPIPVPSLGEGVRVEALPDARPPADLLHGEIGARLTQTVSDWALDASLAVYHGWDKRPVYELRPADPGPSGPPVFVWQARYERMNLFGFDLAKALGPLVLTAEGALVLGEDPKGDDPTRRNHRVESVAGVTWSVSSALEVGVQGITEVLLSYDREAEREALRPLRGGAAPEFVPARVDGQLAWHLRADLAEGLTAQVELIYDATYQDGFSVVFVTYRPQDAVQITTGVVAFAGREPTTPFGRSRGASQAFVEAKLSF